MSTLNHPLDNDDIHPILLAQGSLAGNSLGVIARLTSYSPPQIRYAKQVQITSDGGWVALFTDLPVGVVFHLEVFDETGQLVGSASNLEVVTFGAGPQILFPMDNQQVHRQFATYGIPQDSDPLQCHKVENGANSHNGSAIQLPGMFAFSFSVPLNEVGPGWTLKIGKLSDCSGSNTVNLDIVP